MQKMITAKQADNLGDAMKCAVELEKVDQKHNSFDILKKWIAGCRKRLRQNKQIILEML